MHVQPDYPRLLTRADKPADIVTQIWHTIHDRKEEAKPTYKKIKDKSLWEALKAAGQERGLTEGFLKTHYAIFLGGASSPSLPFPSFHISNIRIPGFYKKHPEYKVRSNFSTLAKTFTRRK